MKDDVLTVSFGSILVFLSLCKDVAVVLPGSKIIFKKLLLPYRLFCSVDARTYRLEVGREPSVDTLIASYFSLTLSSFESFSLYIS